MPVPADPQTRRRRSAWPGWCCVLLGWGLGALAIPSRADDIPLGQRVLVVYKAGDADSQDVATHYAARRDIPQSNVCPVATPSAVTLSWDQYTSTVKPAVQRCLNAVGSGNILYIVLAYRMPYRIAGSSDLLRYALDSYLADVWDRYATKDFFPYPSRAQPYFVDSQSQGNVYRTFRSLADYRAAGNALPIYSVWRLDAANAALAKGLVDKAIAAESSGLVGQACLDRRLGRIAELFDSGYGEGDWDLHRAALFAGQAGFTVTEDDNAAEFGTAPAPACRDAALYAGWYRLDSYNDAFEWNTGAIGFHLDSRSAADPRGGTNWSANAIIKGITVTTGSVAEPYLEGLVRPGGTFRDLLQGANVGDAFLRNTRWLKWMVLYLGDPLYRPFPGGRAPFVPPSPQASLGLSPRYVVNGGTAAGTVTLAAAAPAGGAVVALSSDQPAWVQLPASVTIAAGQRSATFTASVATIPHATASTPTLVTASGVGQNSLIVVPLLGSLVLHKRRAIGGERTTAIVLLNASAPEGGAVVTLTESSDFTSVPPTITVAPGASRASFSIRSIPVSVATSSLITARLNGAQASATLEIQPVPAPGVAQRVRTLAEMQAQPVDNAAWLRK